jgi:hypothetical protein
MMPNRFDEFDQYSEDMLMAQYDISEIISHELMKGEVREDFLITTLESCSEPKPTFVKGTLSDGERDAGQLDIILCKPHSYIRRIGTQSFVAKNDALCVIEVKGNCTGTDINEAMSKARLIRSLQGQSSPLYGIVCYKVALELKTIMKRFGFTFDRVNNMFFDNATIPNEAEADWKRIEYLDLDYFISFEENKKLLLRKYEIAPGKYRFIRAVRTPVICDLFTMLRGIWAPTNQAPAP